MTHNILTAGAAALALVAGPALAQTAIGGMHPSSPLHPSAPATVLHDAPLHAPADEHPTSTAAAPLHDPLHAPADEHHEAAPPVAHTPTHPADPHHFHADNHGLHPDDHEGLHSTVSH